MVAEQFESLLRHSLTRLQRACTSDKRPKDKDAIAALTAECDRCIAALSPGMCAHQKSPTNLLSGAISQTHPPCDYSPFSDGGRDGIHSPSDVCAPLHDSCNQARTTPSLLVHPRTNQTGRRSPALSWTRGRAKTSSPSRCVPLTHPVSSSLYICIYFLRYPWPSRCNSKSLLQRPDIHKARKISSCSLQSSNRAIRLTSLPLAIPLDHGHHLLPLPHCSPTLPLSPPSLQWSSTCRASLRRRSRACTSS